MKRFQRMSAFILALVMILGMIPNGIFKLKTTAAESTPATGVGNTYLHANYAASVAVDGKQDAGYRFDVPVGALRLGAAWNTEGLYLSFNSADPQIDSLKVNGTAIDLTGAVKDVCTEYKIALPENLGGENKLTVKLQGQSEETLYLVFDVKTVVTPTALTANYGASYPDTANKTIIEMDTFEKENGVSGQQQRDLASFVNAGLASSLTESTVLEMDMLITQMPEASPSLSGLSKAREILGGGINISILDDENKNLTAIGSKIREAVYVGLYQNGGKLYLIYWDNGSYKQSGPIDYTPKSTYHLRFELSYTDTGAANTETNIATNDKVTAKYYVNGVLVAVSTNAKITDGDYGAGSGSYNNFMILTRDIEGKHDDAVAKEGKTKTNVTVSNCGVTKTQATLKLVRDIASLGKLDTLDANKVTELRKTYEYMSDADKAKVTNSALLTTLESYLDQVQYVHAEFNAGAMTLDGKLEEKSYRNYIRLNDSVKIAASWTGKDLYLAVQGVTAVTELKLNGSTATYEVKAGTNCVEYKIPLNLPDYSKEYALSFKLGQTLWTGRVVFDTLTYATKAPSTNNAHFYNAELSATGWDTADQWYVILDSYNSAGQPETNDKWRDIFYPVMAGLASSLTEDTVLEMDLKIDYLPSVTPTLPKTGGDRAPLAGGVNIAVVDDENRSNVGTSYKEGMWAGLYQNSGKLYLAYWDNNETDKVGYALVGDYVAGREYHLRIEYHYTDNTAQDTDTNLADNDIVSAKYYINGKLVATSANAKRTGVGFTSAKPNTVLITATDKETTDAKASHDGRTSVTVRKLYASKTNSALYTGLVDVEKVEQFINQIDTVVTLDSEAAIVAARQAYDGLDDSIKSLVSNLSVLEAAEVKLKSLKNSYLHAVFSEAKITANGSLSEAAYKRVLPLGGDLYVSAAWDATNLYLAFAGATNPNVTVLKINGYNVPLTDAKTGTGTWEMAIALDAIGMGNYVGTPAMSFTVNGQSWAGKLVLDTADYEVCKYGALSWDAVGSSDKTSVVLDSFAGTSNTHKSIALYYSDKMASVAGAATVVEFDFTADYLPDGYAPSTSPSREFLYGGVGFTIRDDKDTTPNASGSGDEAFLFGFGKKNGQIYLVYWYHNGTKYVTDEIPVGTANNFYVRVEYVYGSGNDVTANYYINGVLVLERSNSRLVATSAQQFGFSTATLNVMQAYAGVTKDQQSDTNKVVATIRNVSFSHTNPNLANDMTVGVEQVEQMIGQIGEVTLGRKAYIESTLDRYNSLSTVAQKMVQNADVLFDAVSALKVLENSFLHAAFAATSVVVDGKVEEEFYQRNLMLGSVKFGAAWDVNYLYLYFADAAAPAVDQLTINNVTVATTGTAGNKAREIKVKLSDLGITNLHNNYPISITIGGKTWSGKLILDNVDVNPTSSGNYFYGAIGAADKMSFVLDTRNPDTSGGNTYRSLVSTETTKLACVPGAATVLEMAIDPIHMPDNCTITNSVGRAFLIGGIGIMTRDDLDVQPSGNGTKGFLFGLGKINGQMKLVHWYVDANGSAKYAVEDIPQSEGQYYVRVEYIYGSDSNFAAAKYYINGVLVAEAESARLQSGSYSTGKGNLIQFHAGVAEGKQSDTNRMEVAISNLSVGHSAPDLINELTDKVPQVEALIEAIGPVNKDSADKIRAAQAAYEALSLLAQTQVSNAKTLESAIDRLKMLESSYLHAVFTYDEPSLDGKIYESSYRLNVYMTEKLKIGAIWTKNYLYLGFQSETAPTVSDLVINGKKISITSSNSKAGAVAREIRLSLSSLGITGYDKTYPISFRVGDVYWSGTLVQDSNDYTITSVNSLFYGAVCSTDKTVLTLNSVAPDGNGGNTNRSLALYSSVRFASAVGKISIFDVDLDIINMPANSTIVNAPGREFITNGLTFTLRDDLSPAVDGYAREAFNFGFAKQNGKLKLYHWYNDAEGKATLTSVDVPEAPTYHLRIEFGNGNGTVTSAKYYINGILLAEAASVRVKASSFSTSAGNNLQLFAKAATATEAGRVEVRLSGLSMSRPQVLIIDDKSAAAYVDERISDIGTVTMESTELINIARDAYNSLTTAQKKLVTKLPQLEAAEKALRALKDQHNAQYTNYLFADYDTKGLLIDGELKEAIWRTPQTIYGVGKMGAAWDFDYLYLAFTGSKINTLSNLKINGKPVTNLGVTSGNSKEIKILLSGVGIKTIDFKASYSLSFTLDGKEWSGQLVFDTGTYKAIKPGSAIWGGVKNAYQAEFNTLNSTKDGLRQGMTWTTNNLTSLNGYTTILEMDVKVNNMPNNGYIGNVGRDFLQGGIGLTIRDEDTTVGDTGAGCEAFLVGLVRQKGQMMLAYWDDSIDNFVLEPVEDYGTNNYHVRVEYFYYTNDDVAAKFYVNGMLVAETLDAKEVGTNRNFSTSTANMIQVMANGLEESHINAIISNFSISRTVVLEAPEPQDAVTKEAIFGNIDFNHIQQDLVLPTEFVTVNGDRFELFWSTSDSSVVTADGKITRPLEDATSATLTLMVDGVDHWSVTVKVDPMSLEEAESPEYVDAAFSKDAIVIDGVLDEQWRMSGRVLDKNKQLFAEYGFQWTQSHLYIAVEYMEKLDTLSFKLNGRYFTVQDGKLYRGGQNVGGNTLIAVSGNVIEMRIPLNVLGLSSKVSSYGITMPMSLKAGPYVGCGKTLTLSNISWFVTGNRNHLPVGATTKSTDAYHGVQTLINGYRLYDLYGGSNEKEIRSYVAFLSTAEYNENFADRVYDTRMEFDFKADAMPILPTDGSAYVGVASAYGNSGFTCAAGEIIGADGTALAFTYGIINTQKGLLFVLNVSGTVQTHLLNKEVGDKFSIAVEWTKTDELILYVDGVQVNSFPCGGFRTTSAANASLVVNMRSMFSPNSVADNYDVSITNIAFGKVHKETGIMEQIDFDDIRGKNSKQNAITSDLKLPTSITNGQMDKGYTITWTSSNPSAISNTGVVTRPEKGAAPVTLTATLSTGETKVFDLVVYGKRVENDGVLYVEHDINPESGVGINSSSAEFTLDATNNSIIKIIDGVQKINYVVLTDGDDKADLTPESTSLWASLDNKTYTRIKDFKMLQMGTKWYLYDFEVEAQYIKVHYTKPEDASEGTFLGTYSEMIDAGYHTVFGADNVTFNESTYVLTNNTGKDQLDYAWTISKADLGISGNNASIRIYADGKLLYHYVSGTNVVVRVNDMPKGASVTLTVLSSFASGIMDIANKEGVHEVIYGTQNTTLQTEREYYMTLPAGTVFPDGSKLEVETIFSMCRGTFKTSTDGGKTWNAGKVYNNAPEGKEPVTAMSEGGWMYDSKTGRLMYETYNRGEKDPGKGGFNKNNMDSSHMHTFVIISDDGGKTWYMGGTLPCRICMPEYKGDSVNALTYSLSYSDGTELSTNDGKGPNVDFVFPMGTQYDNIGTFACYIAYTRDGGETWKYSTTPITYPSLYGSEGGCSEAWIIEREDGVLLLHVRCQDMSSYHFKAAYSYDHGVTWTNEHIFSNYYAVNGQAFIRKMNIAGEDTVIAAWAGNTSLGSATYHRNPFLFASSANDGDTFRNIQNIYFRSAEEKFEDIFIADTTNVSLVSYNGGDLLFTYHRNSDGINVVTHVEDFDLWFTRTKGAFDDFEKGTLKSEGWNKVGSGNVVISDENARGKYALKMGANSMALRSMPYLQDGTLSIDIYVTPGSDFTVELQSGHTRYYDQVSVPIAFRVEGGKIYFNSSTTAAADGIKEGWNTLTFDLGLSDAEATLSINGGAAVEIPLKMDFDDYVNYINITTKDGATIYLDEFLVISETVTQLSTSDADQAAADKVIALIKAIKNAGDTAAIKAAREAFDAMTLAQQDLVNRRVLANNGKSGLDGMINYYEVLRMYEDGDKIVESLIDEIGTVDKNSGDKIENAEEAYRKLTSAQKKLVDNYGVLQLARKRYDRIMSHKVISDAEAAENVQELINVILLSNPMRYEKQINTARTAYNRLTADQMALVNNGKLVEAERLLIEQKEAFTRKSLASLQIQIDSLDNLTLYDLALVEGIRMKFNSLTGEQRQTLNDRKLLEAEAVLGNLKIGVDKRTLAQYRLEGVIKLINSIGQVTVEKKGLIDAIRYSYDKLTTEQQEKVENYTEFSKAEGLVQSLLQLADSVPNTGDNAAPATASRTYLMPMMLFSTLALAALVIFYFKKRNFR